MTDSRQQDKQRPSGGPQAATPGGGSVFDAAEYTKPAVQLSLTVLEYFHETMARRGYAPDESQYAALQRLQRLYEQWVDYDARSNNAWKRFLLQPVLPRGVYLWGGVGRGKSMLMDIFYLTVPIEHKRRVHFHHFMRDVHREMESLKGQQDPLSLVATHIARRYGLICFDEFHVDDIADAMILGRLLEQTMDRGVVYCMTSNYHPDALYRHGLQRERFLPTIGLLKERLDIVLVDGGIDYRRRALQQVQVYHHPLDAEADAALLATFEQIAEVEEEHHELDVEGRIIPFVRRAGGVVWFDFEVLCGGARSHLDYLDLAKRFHTVIVSNVPVLSEDDADKARRFTWLVDIFYDRRIKLVMSAAVPPEALYRQGPFVNEFARTASRLIEMQSHEYLASVRREPQESGVAA